MRTLATPARILGIDPGLNRTGFGVIEYAQGQAQYVACGVIRVPAGSLSDRLATILSCLGEVIHLHAPTIASIEQVFVNVNPKATLLLGQARGAAICAAVQAGLTVHEYSALQIKQAVVGYGKAAKSQVQEMVMRLLALKEKPVVDAADALACALAHAHASAIRHRLASHQHTPPTRSNNRRGTATRGRQAWAALAQQREGARIK